MNSWLPLAFIAAVSALHPAPLPPPGITDPKPEVVCMPALTVTHADPERGTITLRLTNGSPSAASYLGYGDVVPLYAVQVFDGNDWVDPEGIRGYCGTGLQTWWLKPFASREFEVPIQPGHRLALSLTLAGAADPVVVYSPPLEP